jgi:hypothetical protein
MQTSLRREEGDMSRAMSEGSKNMDADCRDVGRSLPTAQVVDAMENMSSMSSSLSHDKLG